MIVVHDEGVLDCNKTMAEAALANPKMTWKWNRSLASIEGSDAVTGVKAKQPAHWPSGGDRVRRRLHLRRHYPPDGLHRRFRGDEERLHRDRRQNGDEPPPRVRRGRRPGENAPAGGYGGIRRAATAAFFADRALTEMDEFSRPWTGRERSAYSISTPPPVQRSLELFPLAEAKAAELGLPLVKLDTFRYRGVAAKLGVSSVPWLLRVCRNETGDVIPGESIPL